MSTSVHASITETHYQLLRKIYDASLDTKAAVQAIADSEARAVEPMRIVMDAIKESNAVLVSQLEKLASERDTYQREAYHLRKDLCEIAAAFNVGVPDSEEAKKRIIAVKAERDQLHATLERTTIAAAQVADRNVELRAECERLKNERAQVWAALNFIPEADLDVVLADAKLLRPEMAKARARVKELEGKADWDELYLDGEPELLKRVWKRLRETERRAEKAEAELALKNTALRNAVLEGNSLRAEVERLTKDVIEQSGRTVKAQDSLEASILRTADQRIRAEKAKKERITREAVDQRANDLVEALDEAEAELTKERRRLAHLFHHESPMAEPGDTFTEWCADIDTAMSGKSK